VNPTDLQKEDVQSVSSSILGEHIALTASESAESSLTNAAFSATNASSFVKLTVCPFSSLPTEKLSFSVALKKTYYVSLMYPWF